ncbi:MAG: ROK family transcriptional regulator [Actinomycetota bacterium]|nr:ROK family transcriptional regulator [Actinomycetota bacterium]
MADTPLGLRDEGRRRVLQALHDHGTCRRTELVGLTNLGRSTVASLVAELIERGIVVERPTPSAAPGLRMIGRPAGGVALAPTAAYSVGVDIGHEHVRVAVCDLAGNRVADYAAHREVDLAPRETLDLAAAKVRQALDEGQIDDRAVIGLGLGIAAPVHAESGAIEAVGIMPGWVGVSPVAELGSRTGFEVRVINDADAGALGERTYGAGVGVDDLLYLRLSAGVGAGIVTAGRRLGGVAGLAGELGHVKAVEDGLICRCGNRGCLETVAGTAAIADLIGRSRRRPVTPAQLGELLEAGDPGALRAVEDAAEYVGRVVAAAVNVLNPQLVVLGGDLARAGETLLQPVRTAIRRLVLPAIAAAVTVTCGKLAEHAEVLGAATLARAESPRRLALVAAGGTAR